MRACSIRGEERQEASIKQAIIVSVGGAQKDRAEGSLPARKRYAGAHTDAARRAAHEQAVPLFILSGKYGLLAQNELVGRYSYLLEEKEVPRLASRIEAQLLSLAFDVERIEFYASERLDASRLYYTALARAADSLRIPVTTRLNRP